MSKEFYHNTKRDRKKSAKASGKRFKFPYDQYLRYWRFLFPEEWLNLLSEQKIKCLHESRKCSGLQLFQLNMPC